MLVICILDNIADPGKARGCYTNTIESNLIIQSPSSSPGFTTPPAQAVKDGESRHKIDYVVQAQDILNKPKIMDSKVLAIFLMGIFCPLVELH